MSREWTCADHFTAGSLVGTAGCAAGAEIESTSASSANSCLTTAFKLCDSWHALCYVYGYSVFGWGVVGGVLVWALEGAFVSLAMFGDCVSRKMLVLASEGLHTKNSNLD